MCEAGAAGPKAAAANARAVRPCLRPARARRSSASQGGAGVRAYGARGEAGLGWPGPVRPAAAMFGWANMR